MRQAVKNKFHKTPRLSPSEMSRGPAAPAMSRHPFLSGKQEAVSSPLYKETDTVTGMSRYLGDDFTSFGALLQPLN